MVCDSCAAAGKLTWTSGDVYEGEWRDDKRNGQGEERERGETHRVPEREETRGRARAARQCLGGFRQVKACY